MICHSLLFVSRRTFRSAQASTNTNTSELRCQGKGGSKCEHRLSCRAWLPVSQSSSRWSPPIPGVSRQENPVALAGQVRSTAEGLMEGVVVSAKKDGIHRDRQRRERCPWASTAFLGTDWRRVSIRSASAPSDTKWTIPAPSTISSSKTVTSNLTLHNAKDLSSQLTNAEWLVSMPGTDDQKAGLLTCVVCHTLERIVKSRHDAAEFVAVLERMATYTNSSFPLHVQKRPARWLLAPRGEALRQSQQRFAQFLSTINLSSASTWAYPLKTFPRPKGKDTQVIVTEYDLPRADDRAARRHRGLAGNRLVFQFWRTEYRTARSQDGKGH